ncbi:CLUMA_CG016494, isoform A [Clunio marinus]|uniref:CLUMA_CG016494, isoform A n=1 Tax=Clunio marinus TaxID=568069 RepID=A0A1J1IVC9_9DIPT|nr:CLUMA_CG016494, isoform A [Clunio marinus]
MLSFFRKKNSESEVVTKVSAVRSVVVGVDDVINPSFTELGISDEELKGTIYDLLRTIKDPEKPATLEKGAHSTEDEINKQINDRERVAAAIENQNLLKLVENCISEDE